MPVWAQTIVIAAAVIAALATIWRKGLVPIGHVIRNIDRIADATPILIEIADEFRPNGGSTLRDTVDRIEAAVDHSVIASTGERAALEQHLAEIGDELHAHLAMPAWASERGEVLARLGAIVERQALVIAAVTEVLRKSDVPLAVEITAALQRGVTEANR